VKWPPSGEDAVWRLESENQWHAEDFGALEEFLKYRVGEARSTHGKTDLDDALGWDLVRASLGKYLTALLANSRKKRDQPMASLVARIACVELPPDLRALFELWIDHGGSTSIGDELTLYPDATEQAVPDSDGDDRSDLVCIGEYASGDLVAVKWPPQGKSELVRAVHDCGWDLEELGSLEKYLEKRVDKAHDKGQETDLDEALALLR